MIQFGADGFLLFVEPRFLFAIGFKLWQLFSNREGSIDNLNLARTVPSFQREVCNTHQPIQASPIRNKESFALTMIQEKPGPVAISRDFQRHLANIDFL